MEKYRVVEKPRVEAELKENEVRITTQGKMRNSISYATTLFKEKGATEVVLKAMGRAINKTVTIAEIIKRRIAGLHQITVIDSTDITDVYEPIEEGLDRLETTRHVSSITITLSTVPLDTSAPGYQPPIPDDQVKEITLTQKPPRRTAPRGRGQRRAPPQSQAAGGAEEGGLAPALEDTGVPRPRGRGRGRRPRGRRPRGGYDEGGYEGGEEQGGHETLQQGGHEARQQGRNDTRQQARNDNRQQGGNVRQQGGNGGGRPQGYRGRGGNRPQGGGGNGGPRSQQGGGGGGFGQQGGYGGGYGGGVAQGGPGGQQGAGRGRGPRRPRGRGRGRRPRFEGDNGGQYQGGDSQQARNSGAH